MIVCVLLNMSLGLSEDDAMVTLSTTAEIGPDRRLEVRLPDDVPLGMADVVVVVGPKGQTTTRAREELLKVGGTLGPDEAEAFESAHRDCERIYPDDWS